MSTIFRFAIQTPERRRSEVWSFCCNKNQGCLYATRASMRDLTKVSFHASGACHVKRYEKGDRVGVKDHAWRHGDAGGIDPLPIMRVVYDLRAQRGDFDLDRKVKIWFEDLTFPCSVYLNVFFIQSDNKIEPSEETGIVASHFMGGGKWVCFSIEVGPLTNGLPDGVSQMSVHLGPSPADGTKRPDVIKNLSAVWYQVPDPSGVFVVFEAAAAEFSLARPA